MRSVKFCVVLFVVLVFVAAEESERQPSDAELQSEGEKSTKEEVEQCQKDLADFGDPCEVLALIEDALDSNGTDTENVRRARAIIADARAN